MRGVEVEKTVLVPLTHPDTGEVMDGWYYAGAVDRIEGPVVIDWKSSADNSRFADNKAIGYQPECYTMALRQLGYDIREYEYRVLQTPSLRPRKGELPSEYGDRCYEWMKEEPIRLMTLRYPVVDGAIRNAKLWLWEVAKRVVWMRQHGYALTCEASCFAFNSPCPFLRLCKEGKEGADISHTMNSYYTVIGAHSELSLPDHIDPRNVITYSAAAKYSQCEQRYWFTYEMGLAIKGNTSAALRLGHCLHSALEHIDEPLDRVLAAVYGWGRENPGVGVDHAKKLNETMAKVIGMCRAAKEKWNG